MATLPPRKRKEPYAARHRSEDMPEGVRPIIQDDPPAKPGTGATKTRRRKPQHNETKAPAAPASPGGPSAKQKRHEAVTEAARDYANRKAYQATNTKPSVTGRAAAGAASGGVAGAALAGPPGAVAGAALGGTAGAFAGRKAKKAYKAAMSASPGMRRIIVAEFLICMIIIALSPMTDRRKDELPTAFMKRMTAVMALFFILGLTSNAGRGAAKLAAGFGGLVSVTLAISNRDLFMKIGAVFGSPQSRQGGRTDRFATPDDAGRIGHRMQRVIEQTEPGPDIPPLGNPASIR